MMEVSFGELRKIREKEDTVEWCSCSVVELRSKTFSGKRTRAVLTAVQQGSAVQGKCMLRSLLLYTMLLKPMDQ